MKKVRLACATGWARDRFDPAEQLVRSGNIDYLCFDAMSEVTMSAAQVARIADPATVAHDPYLEPRLEPILKACKHKRIRIITNQGWLDPIGAADKVLAMARRQGISELKVAAVVGGILTDRIADMGVDFIESGAPIAHRRADIVSAEVYLGAEGIVAALRQDADVVITTRVADGCLYLGPLAHEFAWDFNDHHAIAQGMIVGHLLECGCQISGGYFADPGYKEVPDLHEVSNPIAEVSDAGIVISKLPDTGGVISEATCKEQLLYEVQDPANYLCPDVVADLSKVSFKQIAEDKVEVIIQAAGKPRTPTLKALIGLREGFMAEEMVLFAGPGAMARAQLTKQILQARFERIALQADAMRMDYIGLNAVHRQSSPAPETAPYEVVLRIALKTKTQAEADKLRREVDPLAVNGAYGTGKWATSAPGARVRAVVGLNSALVPREQVPVQLVMKNLEGHTQVHDVAM